MTEVVSLRAGGRRIDVSDSDRDAVLISDWEWGAADQRPVLVDGQFGGVRVGRSDWETSRLLKLDFDAINGNVPGDSSGLAINRAWGRQLIAGGGSALAATSPLVSWGAEAAVNPAVLINTSGWAAYGGAWTSVATRVAASLPSGAAGFALRAAFTANTTTGEAPYAGVLSVPNSHVGSSAMRIRYFARLVSRTAGITQSIEVQTLPDFRGPSLFYYGAGTGSAFTRLPDDGSWIALANVHTDTVHQLATQVLARVHSRIAGGGTNCPAGEGWAIEIVGHPEGAVTFWDGATQDVVSSPYLVDTSDVAALAAPVSDPRIAWGTNQITNDGSFENGTASGAVEVTANATPVLSVVDGASPDGVKVGQVVTAWGNASSGQAVVSPFANVVPLSAGVGQYVRARGRFKATANTIGRNVQARLDIFLRDSNNAIVASLSVSGATVATHAAWETLEWAASADSLLATYPTARRVSIKVSLVASAGGAAGSTTHLIDGIRLQVGTLAPVYDAACEVRPSVSGRGVLDLMRGSVVLSTSAPQQLEAGRWATLQGSLAAVGGAEPGLTLRPRLLAAPQAATITARCPSFGEGLAGVYFDPYTPGASRARAHNHVRNPRVALGPNGWGANNSVGWDSATGQPSRSLLPGSTTEYGMRCVGTNPTATLRQIGIVATDSVGEWMRVTPGETVYCHLTTYTVTAPATHGIRLQPVFVDAAGVAVQATSFGSFALTPGAPQVWVQALTVPSGAFALRYAAGVFSGSVGNVDVYLTRMGLSRSPIYVDGDVEGGAWLGTPGYSESYGPVGPVSRPAGGEVWANAVLADVEEVVGAVAADVDAQVVRDSDAMGDTLTIPVHAAKQTAKQDGAHSMGYAQIPLELLTGPLALGRQRPLAGAVRAIGGGFPVWTGSEVVPGAEDADAVVFADFAAPTRRQAVVQELDGDPTVVAGTALTSRLAGSSTTTLAGSSNSSVVKYSVPWKATRLPLGSTPAPAVAGEYEVDVRAAVRCAGSSQSSDRVLLGLEVDGSRVSEVEIGRQGWELFAGGGAGWEIPSFGRVELRPGQTVTLTVSQVQYGVQLSSLYLDVVTLAPVRVSARLKVPDALPGNILAGAYEVTGGSPTPVNLNGVAGQLGGAWSATGWTSAGGFFPDGGGSPAVKVAKLGSSPSIRGAVASAEVSFSTPTTANFFGLVTASGNKSGVVLQWNGPHWLHVVVFDSAGVMFDERTLPLRISAGEVWNLQVAIDDGGRWQVGAARSGSTPVVLETGTCPTLGTGPGCAYFETDSLTSEIYVVAAQLRSADSGLATMSWQVDQGRVVPHGDLPRLKPGRAPMLSFRAGGDKKDAQLASQSPTSVTVLVTPRYLTVAPL